MPNPLHAHSIPGGPEAEWEPLERHLAEAAGAFATTFGAVEFGNEIACPARGNRAR